MDRETLELKKSLERAAEEPRLQAKLERLKAFLAATAMKPQATMRNQE